MSSCDALLTCPVCGATLTESARSLRCAAGHSFDVAREGYVDLLPVGHGRSGKEGDTREMLRARRRFLACGHYAPLRQRIEALCTAEAEGHAGGATGASPYTVLEAGCGEGSYIGAVSERVASSCATHACFFGLDVSRPALRLAARSHPSVRFFLNDVAHRICLADASVDVLLNVFAPRNAAEFARVLRPGGLLVVVIPGEDHLSELRAALPMLGIQPDKRDRTLERFGAAFEPAGEDMVEYAAVLDAGAVEDLLRMTPTRWHMDDPAAVAHAPDPRTVTFSFLLLRLRRTGAAAGAFRIPR